MIYDMYGRTGFPGNAIQRRCRLIGGSLIFDNPLILKVFG